MVKSFIVGVAATVLTLFLLKDVEEGYYWLSIRLTVQTLASCVIGGVVVGAILPRVPFQAVGLHASLSAVVGSITYFLFYRLATPPLLPYLYHDIVANLFGSVLGGFVGGVAGSGVKRLVC